MNIIGIHDGHNASICLLQKGKIAGLLQEERLKYEKNFNGFPELALKKILETHSIGYNDIDKYVFNFKHLAYPTDKQGLLKSYLQSHKLKPKIMNLLKMSFVYSQFKKKRKENRIGNLARFGIPEGKMSFVEHHTAHVAAAYFGCPWMRKDKRILVLTQDGSGDGLSGTVNVGYNGEIKRIASIDKEDSLGRLYANITFMLGMVPLEHEYKVMGMAPYSPKSGEDKAYHVFKDILQFPTGDAITWRRQHGLPPVQQLYPYLRNKTELLRFDWICAGLQRYTEEMLTKWVCNCIRHTGIHDIALSGGTFMNVKANQKILELDEVNNLFIFPSCGDESNAIGAAYYEYYKNHEVGKNIGLKHLYYGPDETGLENSLRYIEKFKSKNTTNFGYEFYQDIETKIAEVLANKQIIARCKGPMEFGARALGNRSILADSSDLLKITEINHMIKKRDFWMPFAPVILEERSDEYINKPKTIDASYMMITFDTNENNYKEIIGGVQQVDKTARPQIVNKDTNPDYYKILKKYEEKTGKGVLINTSFNLHGYPIVYGPKEALHVFENSGLKYLALGNYLLKKH